MATAIHPSGAAAALLVIGSSSAPPRTAHHTPPATTLIKMLRCSLAPHLASTRRILTAPRAPTFVRFKQGDPETPAGPADVASKDMKQVASKPIAVGERLPGHVVMKFNTALGHPEEVDLEDLFEGKRAVLFGLPGAFTSVCSSKHVPEYASKLKELKEAGVELVACISVNDAYVMQRWAEDLQVDSSAIMMLGDGDASFHKAIGLTQTLPGLGERARRYSMYLEDGIIKVLNVEEPGGKSYKVSGPSHMLLDLKQLHAGH